MLFMCLSLSLKRTHITGSHATKIMNWVTRVRFLMIGFKVGYTVTTIIFCDICSWRSPPRVPLTSGPAMLLHSHQFAVGLVSYLR